MDTTLVYGFLDAGKTTYIEECMRNDYFCRHGRTLILCFETGEKEYDEVMLAGRNTCVAYYEEGEDITDFCRRSIEAAAPDRIYAEMNLMLPELRRQLPAELEVHFVTSFIDFQTLPLYFNNMRQFIVDMVKESSMVTFRNCGGKELLAPYAQSFRLMNPKAVYLRQDPMGYHEKAFDRFLPYSLEAPELDISEGQYIDFCLDAGEHPEHYDGRKLRFTLPLELRVNGENGAEELIAGRTVMTCCMADIQFMGCLVKTEKLPAENQRGWVLLEGTGRVHTEKFGVRRLVLIPDCLTAVPAPAELIMSAGAVKGT